MIPKGYIQTEIGVIPEDWDVTAFRNVGDFYKGGGFSMRDVKKTGNPCTMYGDIYVKFDISFSYCDYRIDDVTAKNSVKASPKDLLFTASGETAEEIGKCVSYQGKENIYIGGDIIALTPNKNFDSLFLSYVQNSDFLRRQKVSYAQGYSIVHISTGNIEKLIFAAPKKYEQICISETLSNTDALISSLEKLITKKKAIKQGAMQELLTGKTRLPGFTGMWKKVTLGEIGNLTGSGVDKKILPDEIPITLLNYTNVYHQVTISRKDLHHKVTASTEKIKNCSILAGDVLITPTSETPEDIALSAVATENM